jgi:hypothetical protein
VWELKTELKYTVIPTLQNIARPYNLPQKSPIAFV